MRIGQRIGQRNGPARAAHPLVDLIFRSALQSQVRAALYEVDGTGTGTTLFQMINGEDDRYSR